MTTPSARIPVSSHVLLGALVLLFLSASYDIVFQAHWEWWLIPLVFAAIAAVIITQRTSRRRRMLAALAGQQL